MVKLDKHTITHLGKTINTIHFDGNLEMDKINFVRDNFYKRDKQLAVNQILKVLQGGVKTNHIYQYYFEDIANDTVLHHSKFSINQVLDSDELTQLLINRTKINDKVFTGDLLSNFKTAIRIGGKGVTAKPTQFPLGHLLDILTTNRLSVGGKYIDPCAGWGQRMLASAVLGVDYVGFDVNAKLIPRLNELGKDIQQFKPDWSFIIYPQSSADFVPELLDTADFIFTSPPYFNLEYYGDNSLESNNSRDNGYDNWIESFIAPMLINCYNYLKYNHIAAINIKGYKDFDMVADIKAIAQDIGFVSLGDHKLKQNGRVKAISKDIVKNEEKILRFTKS